MNENFQTSIKANFDDTQTIQILALMDLILATDDRTKSRCSDEQFMNLF